MRKGEFLKAGSVVLPAPVSISINNEIIWTSDTGRTLSGRMIGDVVATKETLSIKWGVLTEEQATLLKRYLVPGFFPLTFHDVGEDVTMESYRGTLALNQLGYPGGKLYYESASVDIIQR